MAISALFSQKILVEEVPMPKLFCTQEFLNGCKTSAIFRENLFILLMNRLIWVSVVGGFISVIALIFSGSWEIP